ncbi:unnamed protein product, partial [Mesorhabditis spiculigera]
MSRFGSDAIQKLTRKCSQVITLFPAILCNMGLTVTLWVHVYQMKHDPKLMPSYFLSADSNRTTGSDLYDSLLNGFSAILLVAVVSFVMLGLVVYNFKLLVQSWLSFACLFVLWCLFPVVLRDLAARHLEDEDWILWLTLAGTTVYAGLGSIVFMTDRMPLWMHQMYVVTNCSLISTSYLRALPTHTAWFLLGMIPLWDCFAVLSPNGPLKVANEYASQYSHTMLRMLMFESRDGQDGNNNGGGGEGKKRTIEIQEDDEEHENEHEEMAINASIDEMGEEERQRLIESETKTAESVSESSLARMRLGNENEEVMEHEKEHENGEEDEDEGMNAAQALDHTETLHLGMGDFIFYSLLVGKSLASGGLICSVGSAMGVLLGLVVADVFLSSPDANYPALPISLIFGLSIHFVLSTVCLPLLSSLAQLVV